MEILLLLAQARPGGAASSFISALPILFILIIFWVMLVVPQRRQAKEHLAMVTSLQKGDQVVTAGGLIGEVVQIKEDQVQVRTGQAIVVVERAKISRRLAADAGK
ncbi:preprotein translocase subunit YajC [Longimicrobium terrae]|uniref:Sec translocon accessory complex subunit YajC n=1 Tax=Longimicrobium terrae TaxID=1639882 RepID=A0A841H2U7_9BACT|nr:preprotein translocase subunit YajC [Longimicrobium terrae]MBB4638049.1 preprotein translocase subunit YajC [Longimicrobium terrae]MBB6072421.1 preprotein translocase subunit YajC [Longimicrobium terrae]NNC32165.1 preprotein translocase subunit YajC [Longimicrobium terrae]